MRLGAPRIEPLDADQLDPVAREALAQLPETSRGPNIFRTLARAPQAFAAFLGWATYVFSRANSLSARHRELAILRTGYLCRSGYEFAQHRVIGIAAGITAEEVEAIARPEIGAAWDPLEQAILQACDELVRDHHISDATWAALELLGDRGRMDLVFTVGQYTQVSMLLNSFGVQLDPGLPLAPALDRR